MRLLSTLIIVAALVFCVFAGSPEEERFCGEFHKACQTTAMKKCNRIFQGYSMTSLCKANFDKKTKLCKDYETNCECAFTFSDDKEYHTSEVLQLTFAATNNTCSAAKAVLPTPTAASFSAAPTSGGTVSTMSKSQLVLVGVSLLIGLVFF